MSEKLTNALAQIDKARAAALDAAIGERAYRLAAVLDADGQISKGINRAHRMLNGKPTKTTTKK
jgi:hypothetical protein